MLLVFVQRIHFLIAVFQFLILLQIAEGVLDGAACVRHSLVLIPVVCWLMSNREEQYVPSMLVKEAILMSFLVVVVFYQSVICLHY